MRSSFVPAGVTGSAPAVGMTTLVFACRGRLISSLILSFLYIQGGLGGGAPSDRGGDVHGPERGGSAPDRPGGGVDVPLRAVSGSDGGEVPAASEKLLPGDRQQETALDVLERPVEAVYA